MGGGRKEKKLFFVFIISGRKNGKAAILNERGVVAYDAGENGSNAPKKMERGGGCDFYSRYRFFFFRSDNAVSQ